MTGDHVTACKGCGIELRGVTEEELVTAVQEHISTAHAAGHTPTREQVLDVIRARRHRR